MGPRGQGFGPIPTPSSLRGSNQDRQVTFSVSRAFLTSCRSFSLSTPRRTNGLPSNVLTSDRSWGNNARQGRHRFPQNPSNTTLPRLSLNLNRFPSVSSPSISMAQSPTYTPSSLLSDPSKMHASL